MTKRSAWIGSFLVITGTALAMELWAAWDSSPNTVPWTDLTAEYVPKPITMAVVGLLVAWLPAHFAWAYRHQAAHGGGFMTRYAKGIVAALAAGLTVAQQVLPLTPTQHGAVAIALAILGAIAVYLVPNSPQPDANGVRTLAGPPKGYDAP